jgi:hypothetical protein
MTTNYSYFFQVELLHKYFANGVCNDFSIAPSLQTQAVLNGNRMLAKQYSNKLYVALQVDDANKAFITPANNIQLTFFLRLNNPVFFNYTNLPFTYQPGKIYYFTNRNTNIGNGKNFLSLPAPFNNTKAYHPGDIAADGSGVIFECISSCTGIAPTVANSANWMKVDNNQYVTEADALQWLPSFSTYTFTTVQTNAVIDAFGYNVASSNYTNHVLSKTIPFGQSVKSFKLDLSVLSPGKYKLTVNGVNQMIYINDELSVRQAFAVIEIFNDNNLSANYRLLNGTTLKAPVYSIDFLNRATIWKYILNNTSKGNISVTPADFSFPGAAANTIVSKTPIPLSEAPLHVSLSLSTINNVPVTPAVAVPDVACASPQKLTNHSIGTDKYACSEIFLNF